ncbi:MAG: serine/threonine protein kinase [Nostoc sp. NMS1]|uniref:serine/threonine-protein kinase n=1 Tax=unclassified Nostoc TaxID=2593658 RepID=UPI0025E4F42D|nr:MULTISPECIES: serine/threonine-protein kinase [unclassified Nostoc]MBN3905201.1 serine/threonine protein kinase [Nostoc sp. NMS1]MBN3992696.1 serine/threonine protein kinase [Nostoc sp. NMS2]
MNTGDYINGRYKVIETLGKGGFGCTYLVRDLTNNGQYAAKNLTFARNNSMFSKVEELFEREVETMKELNHSQIPEFIEYLKVNQELYLIQEYIPGVTLEEEITSGKKYNEEEIICLLNEILEILKYIHNLPKKIIHRDIKPVNIIRRKNDDKLVLIDYGGVKYFAQTKCMQSQTPPTVISSGDYTPPEQKGGEAKLCSDIYALGVTAIAAITSNNLPTDRNGEITCENLANISPELKRILSKMIKPLYEYRYQKVEEVLSELKNIRNSSSSQITQVIPSLQINHPTSQSQITDRIAAAVMVVVSIYAICAAAGIIPTIKETKPYKKAISSELLS